MAAYAALVSVMHIIDNLQLHPRPPISLRQKQVDSLAEKVRFLQEFLQGYNSHLGYTVEADPLEIRIANAAYAAEDAIESHIVDRITGQNSSYEGFCRVVEKVTAEMALIEKEAMKIKETVGVQEDLVPRKSKPLDPSASSSPTGQNNRMVGVDDVLFQMKDKLTSHCPDLQILTVVGMGGTEMSTLRMIDLVYCSNSVIFSAKNVLELQEGLCGETTLQVTLKTMDKALQRLKSHNFHVICV